MADPRHVNSHIVWAALTTVLIIVGMAVLVLVSIR